MATDVLQVTGTLVLVRSKETGRKPSTTPEAVVEALVAALLDGRITLSQRDFATGSSGFFLSGKLTVSAK